jgi:hypothetical protein
MDRPLRKTKDDKQLAATLGLYDLAEQLSDAVQVLVDHHYIFKYAESTNRSKESSLYVINKTIIPLLKLASDIARNSAKVMAPIAATQYAHKRKESEKNKAAMATVTPIRNEIMGLTKERKSEPLRRIENTIATENDNNKKRKVALTEQPTQQSRRPRQGLPMHTSNSVVMAAPANGQWYKK